MKKETGFEISADQRQSWVSIAFVWIGSLICVPALMVGGMLGSGLSLGKCLLSILIGYTIICVYMCLMGMQGCDTGLPTAVMATNALAKRAPNTSSARFWPSPASAGSESKLLSVAPLFPI